VIDVSDENFRILPSWPGRLVSKLARLDGNLWSVSGYGPEIIYKHIFYIRKKLIQFYLVGQNLSKTGSIPFQKREFARI